VVARFTESPKGGDIVGRRLVHIGDYLDTTLSPREQEIARLVGIGYPNKTIAGILDISPWTVATHVRRIFNKLGVHGRPAMIAELAGAGFRFERARRHPLSPAPPREGSDKALTARA
jgi:DNA-binding CsgD family transcriptional regulator